MRKEEKKTVGEDAGGFNWIQEKEQEQDKEIGDEAGQLDNFMLDISKSLSGQVEDELFEGEEQEQIPEEEEPKKTKKPLWKRLLIISGVVFGVLLIIFGFLFGTRPGRNILYKVAAWYMHGQLDTDQRAELTPITTPEPDITGTDNEEPAIKIPGQPRHEDYVITCLIFGIEEFYGARNTDSMMLAAINIKDKTIKLASVMRDTYVEVPGHSPSKLNGVYAMKSDRDEGAALLVQTFEDLYRINIDAYASVSLDTFEDIVDLLGGVTIELTARERDYLNSTNYISNPANRNVKAGVQTLNGNQVAGYCRVRRRPTLEGVNNDYGRTLRQQRVLKAIFDKYKSKNLFELISIANTCLSYVRTNLTAEQIAEGLEMLVENGIFNVESGRFPLDDTYYDCGLNKYNGLTYALITDQEANAKGMYQFIFGDTEEEAETNYAIYKENGGEQQTDLTITGVPEESGSLLQP